MFKLVLLGMLSIFAFANDLVLKKGEIMAHTEIFGDSNINPKTNVIDSDLTMKDTIESIEGIFSIKTLSLKSENEKRDEHMYELLNATLHPKISFKIISIQTYETQYVIDGMLTLNGVTKPASSVCKIEANNDIVSFNGYFAIKLTQFNMEPPSLLFLTVRDKIDIKYNLSYTKEK
jgi:polyisoprenoid-binding protein YceI